MKKKSVELIAKDKVTCTTWLNASIFRYSKWPFECVLKHSIFISMLLFCVDSPVSGLVWTKTICCRWCTYRRSDGNNKRPCVALVFAYNTSQCLKWVWSDEHGPSESQYCHIRLNRQNTHTYARTSHMPYALTQHYRQSGHKALVNRDVMMYSTLRMV